MAHALYKLDCVFNMLLLLELGNCKLFKEKKRKSERLSVDKKNLRRGVKKVNGVVHTYGKG
jgi:hypothetical protein